VKLTFPAALFLVFLTLKLTGYIAWSWWWVTAPLWVPSAFVLLAFAISGLAYLCESKERRAARLLREYGKALSRRQS
jgi:hypothetical protein